MHEYVQKGFYSHAGRWIRQCKHIQRNDKDIDRLYDRTGHFVHCQPLASSGVKGRNKINKTYLDNVTPVPASGHFPLVIWNVNYSLIHCFFTDSMQSSLSWNSLRIWNNRFSIYPSYKLSSFFVILWAVPFSPFSCPLSLSCHWRSASGK